MVEKKMWDEFRHNGLLLFVNQILHIFGWAICVDVDDNAITRAYPARVKYRGFDNDSVSKCYCDLSKYMMDNAEELYKEACE